MAALETRILRISHPLSDEQLMPAANALRQGQLVAFPTETVYGLGANALNRDAISEIFRVKGRPSDNPLIVHVAEPPDVERLVAGHSELAEILLREFSPGPLTIVLPRSSEVSDLITAGLDTVAVRIPAHPVARKLIQLAGVPIAAPSANRSGKPSPTRAWHVIDDLSGLIPFIIDDGPCEYGLESTVLDLTGDNPVILRPGAVTAEDIFARTGIRVESHSAAINNGLSAPRSPGMKYRHYAPKAEILLAKGDDCSSRAIQIQKLLGDSAQFPAENGKDVSQPKLQRKVKRIGLFSCGRTRQESNVKWMQLKTLTEETELSEPRLYYIDYDFEPDPAAAANKLFAALRRFDQAGIELIIAEALPEQGMGQAYMNRLTKAAGRNDIIPEEMNKMNLLFVCTGNTCRSPMAEALMKKILHDKKENSSQIGREVQVVSAGIQAWPGQPASRQAIDVLNQLYGIEIDGHQSQIITPELIDNSDWIITMTAAQRDVMHKLFPEAKTKIASLGELADFPEKDIEDPFGGSFISYQQTANEIMSLLLKLKERLAL